MTDPQRPRNTAEHWFLRILVVVGVPAVVFLVLKWAGKADAAVDGAIISACGIIVTVIVPASVRTFRNRVKTG